jgi:hypothetical protein
MNKGIIRLAIGLVNAQPMVKIKPMIVIAKNPSFRLPFCQLFVNAYKAPTICR